MKGNRVHVRPLSPMQIALNRFKDVSGKLARSSHKSIIRRDELLGELEEVVQKITTIRCVTLADCIGKFNVAVVVTDEADIHTQKLLQSACADLKRIAGA